MPLLKGSVVGRLSVIVRPDGKPVGIGAPFVLEESEPAPEALVIETGPVEYPSSSAVVPAPLPPRSTRPAPGAGRSR